MRKGEKIMTQLNALWELQEAEAVVLKLNRELRSTDARKRFAYLKGFLTEQQNIINNMEIALAEQNAKIGTYAAKLEALERDYELERSELDIMQQDDESTSEELGESRVDIESLQDKINGLLKELNELIRWSKKASADITSIWDKAVKARREYGAVHAECEKEKESYAPRYEEAKHLINEKRAQIPAELLKKYEAAKKKHNQPVARLSKGRCGGCNMLLPSIVVRKVSAGDCAVECENCGRILVP